VTGTLHIVATPIGNLEDITLRALRVLGEAEVLFAEDTRAARRLLEHHGVALHGRRLVSCFAGNEAARTAELLEELLAGRDVALLSEAGTPGISDPGERLVAACRARGIPVQVVPGPSAVLLALVGSGLPTGRFLFLGFPPRAEGERQALFGSLRGEPGTLVLLESPERTARTLAELAQALGETRPACVARELTKLHEEYARGTLAELSARYAEVPPRGEVTLVIGGAQAQEAALSREEIEAAVRERLQAGQGAREIAAALALQSGLPRRQIYQMAVALQGRIDS
jgi:16S rRNA (cytidine1402-2'-O)-methyltransferase